MNLARFPARSQDSRLPNRCYHSDAGWVPECDAASVFPPKAPGLGIVYGQFGVGRLGAWRGFRPAPPLYAVVLDTGLATAQVRC